MVALPLSIYIIQLRNDNLREGDIDVSILEQKCKFLFQKGNRKFLRVINYKDLGFRKSGALQGMNMLT